MQIPTNKTETKRFLGTVNYLAKFIPHLSALAERIRDATKEDRDFAFGESEIQAWEELKAAISEDTLLRYYDPRKPAVIECDASVSGLGAVLLQEGRPVSFASRTLTDTERKYHPLELECLAVIFACTKFDQYIYGKKDVVVLSDHRPLETIFKKEMEKSPLRLQKMLLSLQRYGFDLEYRPGHEQVVADMLSRAAINEEKPTADQQQNKIEVFLAGISDETPEEYTDLTDERLERMRRWGAEDETHNCLIAAIRQGWPSKRDKCPASIQNYWTFHEELAVRADLVYRGNRLVVPTKMISEVCKALHGAHQQADGMMIRARDILYWPTMGDDLKRTAESCKSCQEQQPVNRRESLRTHEVPIQPFAKVGTDVCYHRGIAYLVLVDYMSDFIELVKLADETSSTIIEAFKHIFSRHGIPLSLHSDNAPYYVSAEFAKFAKEWQFTHTTSSPTHPRSNGKAESAVKIVKHILQTADEPWKALMEWRASPNRDFASPSERLYSRKIRTLVPLSPEELQPTQVDLEEVGSARAIRQQRMTYTYDKGSRDLSTLKHGQPVLVKTVNDRAAKWRPGTILEPLSNRSYLLQNDNGNVVRRNRTALQAVPNNLEANAPQPDNHRPTVHEDERGPRKAKVPIEPSEHLKEEPDTPPRKTRSGREVRRPQKLNI